MNVAPLLHTQLVPPRVKNLIKRAGLRNTGLAILSHRVTTVVAPAGYGKSIWVSSLLEDTGWPPTAWLSLDRHDIEPSFLLYHLIHAIRKIRPGFGNRSLRTMNSLENAGRDWLIALSSLIEEISEEKEIALVLDDFHLIDKSVTIRGILEHLVRWLPYGTHLLLLSRNSIPLNLYRERLNGELLEIQCAELLFSLEETRELLRLMDLALAEEDVEVIHDYTEGWAAGLRLLGMLFRQAGPDLDKTLSSLKRKDNDFYSYLSNELLAYLPAELHGFLVDSSLLPYLEPDLCNNVLQCDDSEAIIINLHAHGVVSRVEGEITTWRFHHLMGEFLEQKATCLRPPEYISRLRHRAAVFLEKKGDIDRALEQLAVCSEWPAMATLINTHGDKYFLQSGRLDTLNSWLSRLPEEVVNGSHWLLYYKGMSTLHINPDEALSTLSTATDAAGKKGDLKCQLRSLFLMIAAYTFTNNLKKVKETTRRIPVVASLLKSPWSRGVVLVAALSRAAWEDNLRKGVWLSWLAGKSKLDPESQMGYLMFTSMVHFRQGNLTIAGELIEKALCDPYVRENERWTGTVNVIYTFICMLKGDHKKMAQICYELLRLGQKYDAPHQLGVAYRRLAHLHLGNEQLDQARREFALSRNAFIRANNIFMAYLNDLDLILLRVKAGENARDLLPETNFLLDRLNTVPAGQGFDDYALSVAGIIAMEAGQLELAMQRFSKVSLKCKQKGARQTLAGTRLLLARTHLLQGDEDTADSCLRKALGLAEAEKWEYFWDWHPETVYSLCKRALLKKIHPYWASHLLRRWFPQRAAQEAVSLLVYPDESVRNCITLLLKELVRETKSLYIHINCLGGFRVFVNGVEINQSRWKTKKAENLFKFLIIKRRHLKEKIIEELWPESEPRLGDASLRMALTHTRKALGLNDYLSESLILRRGMIYLNPDLKIFTDYELFDASAQNALDVDMDNPFVAELLKQAAAIYRGDFLPDNVYDDWTSTLRLRLHNLYLQVLLKQIEINRRQDRLFLAIDNCRRYLELEPADEPVCRTAMKLLWQTGQKPQALSLFEKLAAVTAREYNASLSSETIALYEKIK
jgi:ATP/maltotriose-dependent transcriptional regulator MalT/DNA-binding SARP family transcriptional activator